MERIDSFRDSSAYATASDRGASFRVLIVDDNIVDRELLRRALLGQGFEVVPCTSVEEARSALSESFFHVAVIDVYLKGENGVLAIPKLAALSPHTKFVALSSAESTRLAVEAVRAGASDFLTKAIGAERIAERLQILLASRAGCGVPGCYGLVGNSASFEIVCSFIDKNRDLDVCIFGERGVGKTAVAAALHRVSSRAEERLFVLSCDDLSENEVLEEVFGAPSDARPSSGLWTQASQGTLLIEGAGSLSPRALSCFLDRLEQETPCGRPRVIFTFLETQNSFTSAAMAQHFDDRILLLTPLRSRREDIPPLVAGFLDGISIKLGVDVRSIPASIFEERASHQWPGNVSELKAFVESYALEDLGMAYDPRLGVGRSNLPSYREAKEAFERDYLTRLLAVTGGNISEASRVAGTHRVQIYRFIAKHEVDPTSYKSLSEET